MREIRTGTHKFYKGSYIIVFYDEDDEYLQYIFDNVRDILKFQKKELTARNVNTINIEIYKALKKQKGITRFLTGELMNVHLIKIDKYII